MDKLRVNFYFPVIDKMLAELIQRFPDEALDFACLDPRHFTALDSEEKLRRLASRYELEPDVVVTQWRLFHHLIGCYTDGADLLSI